MKLSLNPKCARVFTGLLLGLSALVCIRVMAAVPNRQLPDNSIAINVNTPSPSANYTSLQLTLPQAADPSTIHVVLNGNDITSRLLPTTCQKGACLSGALTPADGLNSVKNVVYVTARTAQGKLMTQRLRFMPANMSSKQRTALTGPRVVAAEAAGTSAAGSSSFLLPTIGFHTVGGGGWTGASNVPWLDLGSTSYPIGLSCSGTYVVQAFDRQTLAPIDLGNSDSCLPDSPTLATVLASFVSNGQPMNYVVTVGTLKGKSADTKLNTTAIGGTDFSKANKIPTGYVAIGVPGATPGTAYENYAVDASKDPTLSTTMMPFFGGVLREDQNGNYNFESSDVLEYQVDPFSADPNADHPGVITINLPLADTFNSTLQRTRFLPPTLSAGTHRGGYWLLVLDRSNPIGEPSVKTGCNVAPLADGTLKYTNCGKLYYTGDMDPSTQQSAYDALAADLSAVGPYDLAFLTTFTVNGGYPICCGTPWDVTGNASWYNENNPAFSPPTAYQNFRNALEGVGGSGRATLFYDFSTGQYNPNGAYTFVFSRDTGDPLTGNSAVSTSAYAAAGQTGYIHGVLARNLNGLFQPFQTSQQANSATDAASGPNYLLTKVGTMPPVAWPELSGILLSGAGSVTGQEAAYQYASYTLLTNYYIKGVSGDHLDDIHYFFIGSNANFIDYHSFDPVNLPAPAFGGGGSYCWPGPPGAPYTSPACFAQADFTAVTKQLSTEVIDLTNVLNFMVAGPVNLKDMVATGNANAGTALTGAAASVLASGLAPTASTTQVKVNTSNVLSMFGGIVTLGVDLASDGALTEISPTLMEGIDFWGTALGDTLSAAGSGAGGLHTPNTTTTGIPSRFISFTTTISELATSDLQDQLGIAFDTNLDSILGDWQKLSALGSQITNTSSPFYSSNQVAQNAAIQILSTGAQRSYYMSLMPTMYQLLYFPQFRGVNPHLDFQSCAGNSGNCGVVTNQPDMGSTQTKAGDTNCQPFFMPGSNSYAGTTNTAPALSFVFMPTPPNSKGVTQWPWAPASYDFNDDLSYSPADFYVIVGSGIVKSSTQTQGTFMSGALTQQLFGPSGFNIPLDLFVGKLGPLQSTWKDISGLNVTTSPLGFLPANICSARPYSIGRTDSSSVLGGTPPSTGLVDTTISLNIPPTVVLGEDFTLTAQVTAGTTPVTSGNVLFLQDKVQIASIPLDGIGTAAYQVSGTPLGAHGYQALFQTSGSYAPSESAVDMLTVYANAASLSVSLSATNLSVSYGNTTSPVTVKTQSLSGMAGTVTFSCSGLPVGMACAFNPSQAALTAGGNTSTSVTISSSSTAQAASSFSTGTRMMCFLPAGVLLLVGIRRGRHSIERLLFLGILFAVSSALVGCSGSSSDPKPIQEAGSKTILVNATCGTITQSVPLLLNIQ